MAVDLRATVLVFFPGFPFNALRRYDQLMKSCIVLWLSLLFAASAGAAPIAIAIHGGAGTIARGSLDADMERQYHEALGAAARAGHDVLLAGGSARHAIIAAIVLMEDSPLFNAGRGAVFNHAGDIELDASIMSGDDLAAGAIAGVRRIRNPVALANLVLERSPHVMLVGEGAEVFAAQHAMPFVDNEYFKTERRRRQLLRAKGLAVTRPGRVFPDDSKFGTVGAVALDSAGNLAAATSTGGMTNKRFGRVGDSPIIGAGTYADNRACAISATGHGEYFIRLGVAHEICARVRHAGESLDTAADAVIHGALAEMGADGGVVALDPLGRIVFSFNTTGMYRAAIDVEGNLTTAIYTPLATIQNNKKQQHKDQ